MTDKKHFRTQNATLRPDSLAFRLLVAADVFCRVARGQSLPNALSQSLDAIAADTTIRGAVQDISYHVMRKRGMTAFLCAELTDKPPKPPLLQGLLHCALSLLLHGNDAARYESYTIVDQAVRAAGSHPSLSRAKGLVNAVLRRFLREKNSLLEKAAQNRSAHWNYPDWWIDRTEKIYPDQWMSILAVGNMPPPLTLRVNIRKTTVAAYCRLAEAAGIRTAAIGPFAIKLLDPVPVQEIPGFMDGLVSVQDAAAQLAAPLLALKDGMKVLDACAAPGGKSGHMLELADIDLLALDCDRHRLRMIDENLARLGLKAKTRQGDATRSDWWDKTPFDCILSDVPCTASGIIRRHPDIRWLRRPYDARELAMLSRKILENLWTMLKPGGKLLLATCSIWPEESERQAASLASLPGAVRLPAPGQLLPISGEREDHDGLFYALFSKHNGLSY